MNAAKRTAHAEGVQRKDRRCCWFPANPMLFAEEKSLLMAVAVPLMLAVCVCGCHEAKYPGGRDTADSFCDGRYQVIRNGWYFLHDSKESKTLLANIRLWRETDGRVFFISDCDGSAVLDIQSERVQLFDSDAAAPQEYRARVADLRKEYEASTRPAPK